jgi:branched-subunit amino acid transport protein
VNAWITLFVASGLTLAFRAGPSLIGGRGKLPESVRHANRFAVPALMGALATRGALSQTVDAGVVPVAVAAAVTIALAARRRSMAVPIIAGVAAFALATARR